MASKLGNIAEQIAPPASAKFSSSWFDNLTFAEAGCVQFPETIAENGILFWSYSRNLGQSPETKLAINAEDHAFTAKQLKPIVDGIPQAFANGKRSVTIAYLVAGIDTHFEKIFSFAKMYLFQAIARGKHSVKQARALYSHVQSDLHLPSNLLERFGKGAINSRVAGIHGVLKLCDLDCLLSDKQIWEEVINARLEMVVCFAAAVQATRDVGHTHPLFPSFFFSELMHLYNEPGRKYSTQLSNLRELLTLPSVNGFGFIACEMGHYSAFNYNNSSNHISHFDSLHFPPASEILPAIQWFLQGLDIGIPSRIEVFEGASQSPGTNSCGIAAVNFLEVTAGLTGNLWRGDVDSEPLQLSILASMVVWHLAAIASEHPPTLWWHSGSNRAAINDNSEQLESSFYGGSDFNLDVPQKFHPVHDFIVIAALLQVNAASGAISNAQPITFDRTEAMEVAVQVAFGKSANPDSFNNSLPSSEGHGVAAEHNPCSDANLASSPTSFNPSVEPRVFSRWVRSDSKSEATDLEEKPASSTAPTVDILIKDEKYTSTTPIKIPRTPLRELSNPPTVAPQTYATLSAVTGIPPRDINKENIPPSTLALRPSLDMSSNNSIMSSSSTLSSPLKPTRFTFLHKKSGSIRYLIGKAKSPVSPPIKAIPTPGNCDLPKTKPAVIDISSDSEGSSAPTQLIQNPGTQRRQSPSCASEVISVSDNGDINRKGSGPFIGGLTVKVEPAVKSEPTTGGSTSSAGKAKNTSIRVVKALQSPIETARKLISRAGKHRRNVQVEDGGSDSDVVFLGMTSSSSPSQYAHVGDIPSDPIDLSTVAPPILPQGLDDPSQSCIVPDCAVSAPEIGKCYNSLEAALADIYDYVESIGYRFRKSQSKRAQDGGPQKKYILRCSCYGIHEQKHNPALDPSDHRNGRTIRTGCMARASINRQVGTDCWTLTSAWWLHNHNRIIPPGGKAQRPPTDVHRQVVKDLTRKGPFDRRQIKKVLEMKESNHILEDRQISNLMNDAKADADREVREMGGDVMSVARTLKEKNDAGEGWFYDIKTDVDGQVQGIFWMSPRQIQLGKRYGDILLNDNAFNRNKYGFPLDLGIIIDNFGNSRNVFYALHHDESSAAHEWVLQCYMSVIASCPEVIATDRHASLISAIARVCPQAHHIFCLHHLNGNIKQHLHAVIGHESWPRFLGEFFVVYNAVSPDDFDKGFRQLVARYPEAGNYLDAEIYPCRDRWAWAWVSQIFTAGVRTSGRCESENRVNKLLGGPKQTLTQVFERLNERTSDQSQKELIGVRDSSRRKLNHSLEQVFPNVLELLRRHAGPFALQRSWQEMEKSAYYDTAVVTLPPGQTWTRGTTAPDSRERFVADVLEEHATVNTYSEDIAFISTPYLLSLIHDRSLRIRNVYRISYRGSGVSHIIAALADGRHICDCCMGSNLGIPCRHFYALMSQVDETLFYIGSIRARWLKDPGLDVARIAPVARRHVVHERALNLGTRAFTTSLLSNPLDPTPQGRSSSPINPTLGARTVYHSANTALRQLLGNVETQDDLDTLLSDLQGLDTSRRARDQRPPQYIDPPATKHRGRPRTARLTAAIEGGVSKGGGAKTSRLRPRAPIASPTSQLPPHLQSASPDPAESQCNPTTTPSKLLAQPVASRGSKRARSPSAPPTELAESPVRPRRRRKPRCSQCHQEGHTRTRCYDITEERQAEARKKLRRRK